MDMENFVSELRHAHMHTLTRRRCEQYAKYKKYQKYERYSRSE